MSLSVQPLINPGSQLYGGAPTPQKASGVQQAPVSSGNFTSTANPQTANLSFAAPPPDVTYQDNSGTTPYSAPAPPPDPYAGTVFGSTANFNKIHGDWLSQRDATLGSITDRINNDNATYGSSVKDFGSTVDRGQAHLNDSYTQNELARIEGGRGVQDMVGTGVRSAGVVIGNKPGASTSSARDAIARAYAAIGQKEMNKVGGQYEKGLHDIGIQQDDFNSQVAMDARHLSENKTKIVNDIATEAAGKIASLNAAAATASLDDRLNIEAEKARVKNEALTTLSQLDQVIADSQSRAHPSDRTTRVADATNLANAGQVASNPFQFTADVPAQLQNTGPFESGLPLFQAPKKDQQIA